MDEDIAVPLIFFLFLGSVVLVPLILKGQERARLHQTLRILAEKGQPVPPEVLSALRSDSIAPAAKDLRLGIVLLMTAVALALFGLAVNRVSHGQAFLPFLGMAAFPAMLGLGFLLLWLARRRRDQA